MFVLGPFLPEREPTQGMQGRRHSEREREEGRREGERKGVSAVWTKHAPAITAGVEWAVAMNRVHGLVVFWRE